MVKQNSATPWQSSCIKDIARISTGSKNTEDKVDGGSYPFFVRSDKVERINSYSYDEEAVLTAGDGVGTGKIFHYINGKYELHQRVYRIYDFSDLIFPKFFYWFFSFSFYDRIMQMTAKSSVDSVRGEMIADMLCPCPPLPEQKAIAEALFDIDHLIAATEKLIGKKKDIKKGLMQELLTGKRRLAGFSNVWGNVCLGDILKVCHGKSQHNVEVKVGSYPIWATSGKIGSASSYIWQYPSVLIGRKGTIDRPFYLETPFWCIDTIFYTKIKEQNCAKFIYYLFCTIDWLSMNEASGVPSLSAKRIEAITIQLPSYEEQKEIARVLSTIDNNISCLSVKLEKLRNIKQGMMNELLTGRIRLSEGKGHDEQFDDAVLISAIVNAFYTPQYPLGRKKVQKLLYLARRFQNTAPSGFLKKAAGPYKPSARYSGGEKIAQKSGYVTLTGADKGTLFAIGKNIEKAIEYAKKWDYLPAIDWLVQNFKYTKVDELEVLATVDMAICDLTAAGQEISVESVKSVIRNNAEWSPKLGKAYFSDTNIAAAINKAQVFFPGE